jgi:hypothetical protein
VLQGKNIFLGIFSEFSFRRTVLQIKSYRDNLRSAKQQNRQIEEDPGVTLNVKETAKFINELVSRAEERLPIIEALAADYKGFSIIYFLVIYGNKDDVHKEPPPELLKTSIDNLQKILTEKLLFPKCKFLKLNIKLKIFLAHKPQNKVKSQPETALLDLPCVLDNFDFKTIRGLM